MIKKLSEILSARGVESQELLGKIDEIIDFINELDLRATIVNSSLIANIKETNKLNKKLSYLKIELLDRDKSPKWVFNLPPRFRKQETKMTQESTIPEWIVGELYETTNGDIVKLLLDLTQNKHVNVNQHLTFIHMIGSSIGCLFYTYNNGAASYGPNNVIKKHEPKKSKKELVRSVIKDLEFMISHFTPPTANPILAKIELLLHLIED